MLVADASRRTTTLNAYVSGLRQHPPDRRLRHPARELTPGRGAGGRRPRARRTPSTTTCWSAPRSVRSGAVLGVARARAAARHRAAPPPRRRRGPGGPRGGRRWSLALVAVGGLLAAPRPERREPGHRGPRRPGRAGGDARPARRSSTMQRQLALAVAGGPDPAGLEPALVRQPPDRAAAAGARPRRCRRRAADEPDPLRHQRLPDRAAAASRRSCCRCASGCRPDEVVVYTASMPGDLEYDATLPFPVVPGPRLDAAAHAGRGAAGGRR